MKRAEKIAQLADYWPYQATVLADLIAKHTSIKAAEFGLNLSQWRVLAAVGEAPGRLAQHVVEMTPMDKGIVSRAVAALVEKKLIRREASAADKRSTHLYATPRGAHVYKRVSTMLQRQVNASIEKEIGDPSAIIQDLILAYRKLI